MRVMRAFEDDAAVRARWRGASVTRALPYAPRLLLLSARRGDSGARAIMRAVSALLSCCAADVHDPLFDAAACRECLFFSSPTYLINITATEITSDDYASSRHHFYHASHSHHITRY